MTPGANPPVRAMARAVARAYPWLASVRTAARSTRSLVWARATSDDPPWAHAGRGEERVEPPRQFGQMVAGHLRVEVMLQVVGEFQEERGDEVAPQGAGLGERCVAVGVVREVDGQQWVDPAAHDRHQRVHKDAWRGGPEHRAAGERRQR